MVSSGVPTPTRAGELQRVCILNIFTPPKTNKKYPRYYLLYSTVSFSSVGALLKIYLDVFGSSDFTAFGVFLDLIVPCLLGSDVRYLPRSSVPEVL